MPVGQPTVRVRLASEFTASTLRSAWKAVPLPPTAQPAQGSDRQLDERDDDRKRTVGPDIVADDHRDAHRKADNGVAEHDGAVRGGSFDDCTTAHQEAGHQQDGEKSDRSREKNLARSKIRRLVNASLNYILCEATRAYVISILLRPS